MPLLHSAALGVVQGLTEFWPVSSSAHLLILRRLVDISHLHQVPIDVAAHLGTLLAALVAFRRETFHALAHPLQNPLAKIVALSAVPPVIIGAALLFSNSLTPFQTIRVVAWINLLFAALLLLADRAPSSNKPQTLQIRHALLLGLAQACALLPGASRAGCAYSMARVLKIPPADAARLSMLLAPPLILAALLGSTLHSVANPAPFPPLAPLIVVIAVSFLVALLAIKLFLRLAARLGAVPFVVYRVALSIALLAFLPN